VLMCAAHSTYLYEREDEREKGGVWGMPTCVHANVFVVAPCITCVCNAQQDLF